MKECFSRKDAFLARRMLYFETMSIIYSINQSISKSDTDRQRDRQSVNQSVSPSVSQLVRQTDSLSISYSARQSVNQSVISNPIKWPKVVCFWLPSSLFMFFSNNVLIFPFLHSIIPLFSPIQSIPLYSVVLSLSLRPILQPVSFCLLSLQLLLFLVPVLLLTYSKHTISKYLCHFIR